MSASPLNNDADRVVRVRSPAAKTPAAALLVVASFVGVVASAQPQGNRCEELLARGHEGTLSSEERAEYQRDCPPQDPDTEPVGDSEPESERPSVAPTPTCETGFVYVPPGSFLMGSPSSDTNANDDERPQHEVEITHGMCVGETEVTQGQWRATMPAGTPNPSFFSACGGDCPVEQVDWYEAIAYANELSNDMRLTACYEVTGQSGTLGGGCPGINEQCPGDFRYTEVRAVPGCTGYRLLTEAEWEYVARAGSSTVYPWGNAADATRANVAGSVGQTTAARTYAANPFGLYDTIGNVWEWVGDQYVYASSPRRDPPGAPEGSYRVIRGGSWNDHEFDARTASRIADDPTHRYAGLGFRLTRSLP